MYYLCGQVPPGNVLIGIDMAEPSFLRVFDAVLSS
jgi:hypothetical protein